MREFLEKLDQMRHSIPIGYALDTEGDDVIIRQTRQGMGCMTTFVSLWLVGWTGCCVFLLKEYLAERVPVWFVLGFWAGELGVGLWFARLMLTQRTYRMNEQNLVVETAVLVRRTRQTIPRKSIRKLVVSKDPERDEDQAAQGDLKIEAEKETRLIRNGSHKKCLWLGQVLQDWTGIELVEDSDD